MGYDPMWELENILKVALSAAKDEAAQKVEIERYIEKALIIKELLSKQTRLLKEVLAMDPITTDHNEEQNHWCVFCQEEAEINRDVVHNPNCLWLRIVTSGV